MLVRYTRHLDVLMLHLELWTSSWIPDGPHHDPIHIGRIIRCMDLVITSGSESLSFKQVDSYAIGPSMLCVDVWAKQHGLPVRRSIYAALHSSGSPRARCLHHVPEPSILGCLHLGSWLDP